MALDLALLPAVGVIGAAIATDVAFFAYVAGHVWICKQLLGLDLRPLGVSLVRCLAAAASMAGVLALFGTSSLSAAQWIAGSAAGLAVFVGVLSSRERYRLSSSRASGRSPDAFHRGQTR